MKSTENSIYEYLKENRKLFFKSVYKNFGKTNILTVDTKNETILHIREHYFETPNYAGELMVIHGGLFDLCGGSKRTGELIKIHDKYWERLEIYCTKKGAKLGKIPILGYTEGITELIARGFKHWNDVNLDLNTRFTLHAHFAPLWWPEDFGSHQEALTYMAMKGIAGHTGTKIPKNK